MEKIIRQSGNSKFIRFDKEDCKINNIETGDVIIFEIQAVRKINKTGEKDDGEL